MAKQLWGTQAWSKALKPTFRKPATRAPELEEAPSDFMGTYPEWLVYQWLTKRKIPFTYQAPLMGGRPEPGGAVGDFVLSSQVPPVVLRVMGLYWHRTPAEGRDMMQKLALIDMGYVVVDVFEDDLKIRLEFTMKLALAGQEVLR